VAERKVRAFDGLAEDLVKQKAEAQPAAAGRAPTPTPRGAKALGAITRAFMSEPRDGQVVEIPVSSIRPNPHNFFHVDEIEELAADIKAVGLLHPLVVRYAPDEATDYELISGERRWRALKLLSERDAGQARTAQAVIRVMTDDDAAHALISANVETRELTVRERIEAISRMRAIVERQREAGTVSGKTATLVAEAVGMAAAQVKRYQTLAAAVPELVEAVDADLITLRTAVELAAREPEIQTAAIAELRATHDGRKHTEAEAAEIVARVAKPAPKKRPASAGPVERVEKSLRSSLMTLKRVVAIEDAKRHEIAALAREIITLVEEGTEG